MGGWMGKGVILKMPPAIYFLSRKEINLQSLPFSSGAWVLG